MHELPSKLMTVLPGALMFLGTLLGGFGTYYEGWAADNPDSASLVGISAAALGVITGIGGYCISLSNQFKAASAVPKPPKDSDGEQISAAAHLVAMATTQAMNDGDHALARRLIEAIDPQKPDAAKVAGGVV